MHEAVIAIDEALASLDILARNIKARKSKQIATADEKDSMKAVASAWYRNFKTVVQAAKVDVDLVTIDDAFAYLLDSSARNPLRSKAIQSIKSAKSELKKLRPIIGAVPSQGAELAANDTPPDFVETVADGVMRAILVERWEECVRCIKADAPLAACVMMGGLLESLLLARINAEADPSPVFKAKTAPKIPKTNNTKPLKDWGLVDYLAVAEELGWITTPAHSVGNVIRDYRNYIHPNKQLVKNLSLTRGDAEMFWEIVKSISRQLT